MKEAIKTSRNLSSGRMAVPAGSVEYHHLEPLSNAHCHQGLLKLFLTVQRLCCFSIQTAEIGSYIPPQNISRGEGGGKEATLTRSGSSP